jgi:nucleoside 2-deoxyribosyltransferase
VIKETDDTSYLEAFKNWVVTNNLYKIKGIDAESVVKIFDKVLESEVRIFMAMKYYSDKDVDDYNKSLRKVVDEIKAKNTHINLSSYPIMREEGASMDIVQNILNNIRNCEIFIVDISENNQNVFFEYGYAHSLNKKIIVIKKSTDKSVVPFDVTHNLRLAYKGLIGLEKVLNERIRQTIVQLGYILND